MTKKEAPTHRPSSFPRSHQQRSLTATLFVLAALAPPLAGQTGPGNFAYFPTGDPRDGRMLSLGCQEAFDRPIRVELAIPAAQSSFQVVIFDGDSGRTDDGGLDHWDDGTDQLLYRLYFDPSRESNTAPEDLVVQWSGNDPNPLSSLDPDRSWTAASSQMPDNDWWSSTVETSPRAYDPESNSYFYHFEVLRDPSLPCTTAASDFKLGIARPGSFQIQQFGFEGSMRQIVHDGPIVFPEFELPIPFPRFFLETPTTYDGTFDFLRNVGPGQVEFILLDGDFDFGTLDSSALPSGVALDSCADEDDPDTAADYSNFPPGFDPGEANPEGVNAPGDPPDDNRFDILRRGEPGNPDHLGCTRYEVIDPYGTVYRNDNPSGGSEWEQFRIATRLAADPDAADYGPRVAADGETFVTTDFLPAGIWRVRLVGTDMANINYWDIRPGICAVGSGGQSVCNPPETPVVLYEIPTLSSWNLCLLVLGLAAAALARLRRRRIAAAAD